MNHRTLLEHHLYFLSTHRGNRESLEQVEFIHSEKPSFNIAFPLSSESITTIGSMFNIYIPDWLNVDKNKLIGWEKTGSITYMILSGMIDNWKTNNKISVREIGSTADMKNFSLIQGKGFCQTEDDFKEWHPWMSEKNITNISDINQRFYVGYYDEKPLGVCLSIIHNNIIGVYAVATLPEYRKQGISATIMKQAIHEAQKSNIHSVTLQVMTNSYAHQYYKHLGFSDAFHCNIFTHE